MGYSKPYLRIFAFAGVLIIVGGLLFGLFQEARAVEMSFSDDAPTTVTNRGTFTFDIIIPQGEAIPIESIDVVIEQQNPAEEGQTGVNGKHNPLAISRASCPFNPSGGMACSSTAGSLNLVQGPQVVTSIELTSVHERSSGLPPTNGYTIDCTGAPAECTNVDTPGYGYDTDDRSGPSSPDATAGGAGYGYGYEMGRQLITFNSGTGYGYDDGDLVFRFDVDISTTNLANGKTHYITAIAATGQEDGSSLLFGDFSTPFHEFTAIRGGGGGAGGGAGGAGAGPITVDAGQPFSAQAGKIIKIAGNLPSGVLNIQIELAKDCTDCKVQVTRTMTRPGGTPDPADTGFEALFYLEITLLDADDNEVEDGIAGGFVNFEVTQDERGDHPPRRILLLRHENPWVPLDTSLSSASDADPLAYNATLPGFSYFAAAADTQGPTFSDMSPTGITQQVTPTVSADWDDNREVNTNSLVLTIDGVRHTSSMGDLSRTDTGFTYVPGTALSVGEHEVSATVQDVSGLETTETWSFQITSVDCPTPPRILSTQPTDGATGVATDVTITVTVEEGSCAIENSRISVNGQQLTSSYANGELTATLTGVDTEETVDVRAQVTDTGGNNAAQSWSFTTGAEEVTPPGEDGGIPGWVWVIIVLLVIAAAVGGWYYYDQQQNK